MHSHIYRYPSIWWQKINYTYKLWSQTPLIWNTWKLNLSLRASSSFEFRELFLFFYESGQTNIIPFNRCFPNYLRAHYTSQFIEHANEIRKRKLKCFSFDKFETLAIDVGKINGISHLTVVIITTKQKPLISKNERYFQEKTKNYREIILDIIKKLQTYGIQITSLVADNQRSQVKVKNRFNLTQKIR